MWMKKEWGHIFACIKSFISWLLLCAYLLFFPQILSWKIKEKWSFDCNCSSVPSAFFFVFCFCFKAKTSWKWKHHDWGTEALLSLTPPCVWNTKIIYKLWLSAERMAIFWWERFKDLRTKEDPGSWRRNVLLQTSTVQGLSGLGAPHQVPLQSFLLCVTTEVSSWMNYPRAVGVSLANCRVFQHAFVLPDIHSQVLQALPWSKDFTDKAVYFCLQTAPTNPKWSSYFKTNKQLCSFLANFQSFNNIYWS